MRRTDRQITAEQIVRDDAAKAREAARLTVAMQAPYSYAQLKQAHRVGALVEFLSQLDSYTLRAQAVRYCLESPLPMHEDEVERRWVRLLVEARWGRIA